MMDDADANEYDPGAADEAAASQEVAQLLRIAESLRGLSDYLAGLTRQPLDKDPAQRDHARPSI